MNSLALAAIILALPCAPASAAAAAAPGAKDRELSRALNNSHGKLGTIKELLAKGADPAAALGIACFYGEEETARYLIEKGADVNGAGPEGATPLIRAAFAKKGGVELTKLLLSKGAQANLADKKERWPTTPLSEAIHWENFDTARVLLEAGADANATLEGDPVLYRAGLKGQLELVRQLVEHGADPKIAAKDGSLPLNTLFGRETSDSVVQTAKVLLEHGADPNGIDKDDGMLRTPLNKLVDIYGAAETPARVELAKALIAHGANVNAVTKDGCTLVQAAGFRARPSRSGTPGPSASICWRSATRSATSSC